MKIKKKIFNIFFIIITIFNYNNLAYAVDPNEILNNPEYENRARSISKNIRCLVCQNQSIDDSNAPLAKDLRILIREKISQGSTDKEIYNFLNNKYGDFIFLKPPFKLNTFALWILPFIFFIIAITIIYNHNNRSR